MKSCNFTQTDEFATVISPETYLEDTGEDMESNQQFRVDTEVELKKKKEPRSTTADTNKMIKLKHFKKKL